MNSRKLAFVLNPRSGRQRFRRSKQETLRVLLAGYPGSYRIFETEYVGHATQLAAAAAADGFDVVVAYGGDGTVNEVASGLVGTRSALGIIPAGSGNGLARGLGVPLKPRSAVEVLKEGEVREIDVGDVDGAYFFNVFGLGFDACLADRFHRHAGLVRGPLPYFTLGVQAFFQYRAPKVEVDIDGEKLLLAPFALTVANGPQYGVGARIAPGASLSDGYLDLVYIDMLPALRALATLPRLFRGTIGRIKEFHHRRVGRMTLRVPPSTAVQFDGEVRPVATTELHVSVLPAALRVIAP
ncbi:MAG: diacylglycerol kinase family protein [Acidobacteriota bacterium]